MRFLPGNSLNFLPRPDSLLTALSALRKIRPAAQKSTHGLLDVQLGDIPCASAAARWDVIIHCNAIIPFAVLNARVMAMQRAFTSRREHVLAQTSIKRPDCPALDDATRGCPDACTLEGPGNSL